jgi:selenide,water dikinase
LLGGGHSHIQVLKRFGMTPVPGIRLTIVSRELASPYSGMLPGHVAGLYSEEQMHFDLPKLAGFAGARLIHDEATAIDLQNNQLEMAGHPPLRFDLLSVNIGGVPLGVSQHVTAVKPIGSFLPKWRSVQAAIQPGQRVAVVGGGAGGCELALAMRTALPDNVSVTIVCTELLPGFAETANRLLRNSLFERQVELIEDFRVTSATTAAVSSDDGREVEADHIFWVTGVAAAPLLRDSGITVDDQGFVVVDAHLRSISHPQVFAAGDIACLQGQQRPKSGVFAVRQGPVLADNLTRSLLDKPLRRYRAQEDFLVLMGTGNKQAIASRGSWAAQGRWAWWWKHWIDTRFMKRFGDPPVMTPEAFDLPKALKADAPDAMRCGGCGAKLGASPLLRALSRLPDQNFSQVALGIGDDAAIIQSNGPVILTIDGFRSLINDPYLFGRITAHHSLNDILAMGGEGVSALALATVPLMAEAMMEDDLFQMLKGAVDVLNEHGVPLVGGHSAEGAELSLALTVTGQLTDRGALAKSGLSPGQVIVLTKPLGTGVLLAAHMRGSLPASALEAAVRALDTSNAAGVDVLVDCGASALTDVSGFGFAGHLSEMLRASNTGARIDVARIPSLPLAKELLRDGISSSLQENNAQALADYAGADALTPAAELLADPQTAGGMLAGVPADRLQECLARLHEAGYPQATAVGEVTRDEWRLVDA